MPIRGGRVLRSLRDRFSFRNAIPGWRRCAHSGWGFRSVLSSTGRGLLACALIVMLSTFSAMGAYLEASGEVRASSNGCDVTWISLQITNRTGAPQGGEVTFTGWGQASDEIKVPVAPIPSGASRHMNLAVPIIRVSNASIRDADGVSRVAMDVSYNYNELNRDYLLVNSRENQLTDTQLDDFTRAHSASTPYAMAMGSRGTTSPLMASERIITQMEPSALPENWLCLMPLKQINISENVERQLTPGQRQALDTWTRLGGNLIYFDSTDEEPATVMGRGLVLRTEKNPVLQINASYENTRNPSAFTNSMAKLTLPYAEPYTGGRTVLFVLISVFMIAVGPVNYMYYARRNNIRALLKTVPVVSMGFCGLIAIYFLATEGFARKGGSVSITMLDEANNRAMTFAQHSLISGLYPTGGFTFNRETYLHPASSNLDSSIRMVLGKEIKLTDGLFRPKIPFNYMTVTPHTTRERLVIDPGFQSVRNGFELPLKAIAVFNGEKLYTGNGGASGAEIALNEGVLPGAQIPLEARQSATDINAIRLLQSLKTPEMTETETKFLYEQAQTLFMDSNLTSGTIYAAIFDGVPPGVEPGVTISDGKNMHVIFGVVDTEASE